MRRSILIFAVPGLFALLLVTWAVQATGGARRFLADVTAGRQGADAQLAAIHARPISWTIDGRKGSGDLYIAAENTAPARLVMLPGLVPAGREDRDLVYFARCLARAGFAVLLPEVASFRTLRLRGADIRVIGDAVRALSALQIGPNRHSAAAVGLGAISYGVGPALLAALMDDVKSHIAFLLAIGGYYDLAASITYATTGCWRREDDVPWHCQAPNDWGKWTFARINAARIGNASDRSSLESIAARKLRDKDAAIADLVAGLGPEGRAVMALLANQDPDRVAAFVHALPPAFASDFKDLDPAAHDIRALTAPVLLIHGRDDPLIPASESRKLAALLPHAHLTLVDSLRHVEFKSAPDLADGFALFVATMRLLALKDANDGLAD